MKRAVETNCSTIAATDVLMCWWHTDSESDGVGYRELVSCSMKRAATDVLLVQHPHSPSIGNGTGVGCNEVQHMSCSTKRALQPLWHNNSSKRAAGATPP